MTETAGIIEVASYQLIEGIYRRDRLSRVAGQTVTDVLVKAYRYEITVSADGTTFTGEVAGEIVLAGAISYEDGPIA